MRKYKRDCNLKAVNEIKISLLHRLLDEVESLEAILMDDVVIERDAER